jgi:hypothetical protein
VPVDDGKGAKMAKRQVDILKQARDNFVRKRREMAEQMIPDGAAAAHFAPAFAELQAAIDAIDRAMTDEAAQPDEFDHDHRSFEKSIGSNVERVDFDRR